MTAQFQILVIDDETDNFDVIESLLEAEDYQLSYAPNGQKALDLLQTTQPDVILLDVMMPEICGIEFCRHFKSNSHWSHIPVIMVTALASKEDLSRCLEAGADDFISKPVHGTELRARIRSMLRIKQQYDRVQSLLELREDMVNMMVHDLRNPLASILLSAELLQRPGIPPEKRSNKVGQIVVAGRQLQSMIDTLLIMAKLESGKMVLNYTDVDLCALCTSAITDFEAIAAQKNLQLVSKLPDPGGCIQVDAALFRRVIDNLLSNAIKFSPSHQQIILQATYLEVGGAKIQVFDSGKGVSEQLRQAIFEKYEIGTLKEDVAQIGLGLAFCKLAIEAHRGCIYVEDNYPEGAIFTIAIP